MSEEEAAKAVLAEAEFFKLKKLTARAKEELGKTKRALLWPLQHAGGFFKFEGVRFFPSNQTATSRDFKEMLFPVTEETHLYLLPDLQLRITPSSLQQANPTATSLRANFMDRPVLQAIKAACGMETFKVEYWEGGAQQALVAVDGEQISLELLLQWAANPSPSLSKIHALQPLTDIFHPELVPQNRLFVTLHVKSSIGYFRSGALRLVHLDIRSQDQGYAHLTRAHALARS